MLSRVFGFGRRPFDTLSEQEMLALAISSEEDDGRIYRAYADGLREQFPQSAKVFDEMAEEEDGHRARLIERHRARFGERIPLIRREHVRGYYERKPDWLVQTARHRHGALASGEDGGGRLSLLRRSRETDERRRDAQTARRSCGCGEIA